MSKYLLILLVLFFACQSPQKKAAEEGQSNSAEPLFKVPLGVQAYTFRNSFPQGVEATLDSIANLGIVELEGGPVGDYTPEEFRKLCEDRGITIPSTGAGYQELVDNPQAVADKAKALGASFVMCAWIPHDRGAFNLDNAKEAVSVFNKAGKVLKEN